jgi:uncharacterized protein
LLIAVANLYGVKIVKFLSGQNEADITLLKGKYQSVG